MPCQLRPGRFLPTTCRLQTRGPARGSEETTLLPELLPLRWGAWLLPRCLPAHHITQRVHGHVGHSHTLNNGFLVDKLGLETSIWDLHAHTLCVCRRKMGEKESEAAEEEGGAR